MSFSSIITDLNTVATAFTSLNDFAYNEINNVNEASNDFPMLLVDKRNLSYEVDSFTRTGLPSSTTLELQLYLFDTYPEAEKLTTNLQTKQQSLLDISYQLVAELRERYAYSDTGYYLDSINYNLIDEAHNEQLIQVGINATFIIRPTDCTLGTFNY